MEAQLFCLDNEAGVLASPQTWLESEFFESLISHLDSNRSTEAVWLNIRRGDVNEAPAQFFNPYLGK